MKVNPLRPSSNVDLPDVVLHLTGRWGPKANGVLPAVEAFNSAQRLASILWTRSLLTAPVFGSSWPVACFSHTTRRALASLMDRFDGLGVAFHAQSVFAAGGGPALYVRGDEYESVRNDDALSETFRSRIVRWWPGASADGPIANAMLPPSVAGVSEWTHEREWRLPRPADTAVPWAWVFKPEDVAFLLVPSEGHGTTVWNQFQQWHVDPNSTRSDLGWLSNVPVASRSGDVWVFPEGRDVPQWT